MQWFKEQFKFTFDFKILSSVTSLFVFRKLNTRSEGQSHALFPVSLVTILNFLKNVFFAFSRECQSISSGSSDFKKVKKRKAHVSCSDIFQNRLTELNLQGIIKTGLIRDADQAKTVETHLSAVENRPNDAHSVFPSTRFIFMNQCIVKSALVVICHNSSYKQGEVNSRVYIPALSQKEANGTCTNCFEFFTFRGFSSTAIPVRLVSISQKFHYTNLFSFHLETSTSTENCVILKPLYLEVSQWQRMIF